MMKVGFKAYSPGRSLLGVLGLTCGLALLTPAAGHAQSGAATVAAAQAAPSPTPTEAFESPRCGNGIVEPGELCDDGNTFGGDGCSADCSVETVVVSSFEPVREYVVLPSFNSILLRGSVTLAVSQSNKVAVRSLDLEPDVVFGGYVCTRAVASPDRFGPGNVGVGSIGGANVSIHLLRMSVAVQRWYGEADRGPDGIPCTDDDPKLYPSTVYELPLELSLSVPEPCAGDSDGDGKVTIDEIIAAVHNSLTQCPLSPLAVVP
jgi:cysteine-rich repeat protein